MPSSTREAYFALRAFNAEIASVKDSSRPTAGRARDDGLGDDARSRFADNDAFVGVAGGSSLATRLRMRWWMDAISEMYDDGSNARTDDDDDYDYHYRRDSASSLDVASSLALSPSARHGNPTLRSLARAIRTRGLTHRFLRRLVEARESDLDVVQYDTLRDVAQYGEDTTSSVLYLTLECVGVSNSVHLGAGEKKKKTILAPAPPSTWPFFHSN